MSLRAKSVGGGNQWSWAENGERNRLETERMRECEFLGLRARGVGAQGSAVALQPQPNSQLPPSNFSQLNFMAETSPVEDWTRAQCWFLLPGSSCWGLPFSLPHPPRSVPLSVSILFLGLCVNSAEYFLCASEEESSTREYSLPLSSPA